MDLLRILCGGLSGPCICRAIRTRTEAEDIIVATLAEIGIQGAEIQDKQPLSEADKQSMFVAMMPDMPEDDGIAYVSFYLDQDENVTEILKEVRQALKELSEFMDIGDGSIAASETEDKDWINNWKEYFKQFYVDDILVIPSWEEGCGHGQRYPFYRGH